MINIRAVIQAGGRGARLMPYTLVLPKPIMPVGEAPVVDILLKWLRKNGVKDVSLTVGYLGALIKTFCGDGSQWDMNIQYFEEKEPLGTVGALQMMSRILTSTFLVLNGDVVTDLNLRDMVAAHKKSGNLLTVGVSKKAVHVDLGVIDEKDNVITGFREKPTLEFLVSMGIYCMEPGVLNYIPSGVPFGFDDLVYALMEDKKPISVYHHTGYWMDIGRPSDFQLAQQDYEKNKHRILGI